MNIKFHKCFSMYPLAVIKKTVKFVEQLVYPLKCIKCGTYIDPDFVKPNTIYTCFCDICMQAGLYPIGSAYCVKCGLKYKWNFEKTLNHDFEHHPNHPNHENCKNYVCQTCIKTPFKVGKVRAAVEYKGIIKEAIPMFKYSAKLAAAKVFEQLVFQTFLRHYEKTDIDLIIPMPLHKHRLCERGFNQSFLIIRNFDKLYRQHCKQSPSWRIDTSCLIRIKQTKSQTGFDTEQRKKNLSKAFKIVIPEIIRNKHILLTDDVFTTGSTCNEAAVELLKHGAARVDVLVIARA